MKGNPIPPSETSWPKVPDELLEGITELDCARVFGVDYVRLLENDGGELYVTRFGWPLIAHIRPHAWYDDKQYASKGYRLPGGTGMVYRVPTHAPNCTQCDLVVKFNRFAQNVPLEMASTLPPGLSDEEIASARFNSPFEEFALLRDLRRGLYGPEELRIYTKRALAIYCPARTHQSWQLGRDTSRFTSYRLQQEQDQAHEAHGHVALHQDRQYVTLFAYVPGENAEDMHHKGVITRQEMEDLTERSTREMYEKGFSILDHKPRHLILRTRHDDGKTLLTRRGKAAYVLVDFELLQRTKEYVAFLREHT